MLTVQTGMSHTTDNAGVLGKINQNAKVVHGHYIDKTKKKGNHSVSKATLPINHMSSKHQPLSLW